MFNINISTMRKLLFTAILVTVSLGFMSCQEEVISPNESLEPIETTDPGGSGDLEEGGGQKGG